MPIRRKNGFTLIELLVVVFIMGLLMALIMPNFIGARQRAQDGQTKSIMNSMRSALRLYYNDNNAYPTPNASKTLDAGFFTTYMPEGSSGINFSYVYATANNNDVFTIGTTLLTTSGDDDTSSQAKCGVSPAVEGQYYVCAK